MRVFLLLAASLALLGGCGSTNINALNNDEVAVGIRDFLFFCTVKTETNPDSCSTVPSAQPGDICVQDGTTIKFKSLRRRNNQFLIVPVGENPFRATDGSGAGCAVISDNGQLDCKVEDPSPVGPGVERYFKYAVFGQGCSQSLDPRVYIIRPRG